MAGRIQHPVTTGPTDPRNVEQITRSAQEYIYNAEVPIRFWLRSATALLKEAEIYMQEGDEETTYLLLYRHAHLILAHLTTHSGAKDPAIRPQLEQAKKDISRNLKTLDVLKPRINQRYETYVQRIRHRESMQTDLSLSTNQRRDDKARTHNRQQDVQRLLGHEHRELAVEIAHRERRRRAATSHVDIGRSEDVDYSRQVSSIQRLVERKQGGEARLFDATSNRPATYNYPNVRASQIERTAVSQTSTTTHERSSPTLSKLEPPPVRPPKISGINGHLAPAKPEKVIASTQSEVAQTHATYTFAFSAYLENGTPLRTLFLPPTLRTTFLRIAHKNTQANLETCAILAGTIISNALFVSKLIVPDQTATPDTCDMINESELFDYIDSEKDLIVLGWIHTHPSQTCFMSSRDLHTHASYQMMLAESIAIVCAPSKGDTARGGDWGVFRLTDPPGKPIILKCTQPGTFHPHEDADDRIYIDARRPGHVVEASGLEFEVVDLRTRQP